MLGTKIEICSNVKFTIAQHRHHLFKEANAMFQVTPLATKRMAKYFEGREILPVRIFYNSGG
jgi:hypothetical protein